MKNDLYFSIYKLYYIPLIYNPSQLFFPKLNKQYYDVLFMGNPTPRRTYIFNQIKKKI